MSASKCFAVIGDSRGIGEALREQLLGDGHQVIGVSRSGVQRPLSGANDLYQSLVFDAVQHPCDLSGFADCLDGLVYCPGSISLRPLRGLKREQFLKDWEINFYGAVQTLQANQALLNQSACASVVLFSTVAVATGMAYHSSIAAAKGAVEGLTRSLAAEWAPKIRVNAIAPSLTDTPLAASLLNSDAKRSAAEDRHPMKRITSSAEVASLAAWLLDSNSSSMSGQVLALDGGISGVR
jgi:NAD(P)-dependent dehydrogenase (short-subunit alcohol dehydrogenase family)